MVAIDFVSCDWHHWLCFPFVAIGLRELSDLVWAPLQTALIMAMHDTMCPKLKCLSFLEQTLLWADFVPSANIGRCLWNKQQKQSAAAGDSITV